LAAYGTPLFVYSQATLLHHLKQLQRFVRHHYLLQHQNERQHSHRQLMIQNAPAACDVRRRTHRALTAGCPGEDRAGVKTDEEMRYLGSNVLMFNVESAPELHAWRRG
jgi:diaminopimelate decarboxylase